MTPLMIFLRTIEQNVAYGCHTELARFNLLIFTRGGDCLTSGQSYKSLMRFIDPAYPNALLDSTSLYYGFILYCAMDLLYSTLLHCTMDLLHSLLCYGSTQLCSTRLYFTVLWIYFILYCTMDLPHSILTVLWIYSTLLYLTLLGWILLNQLYCGLSSWTLYDCREIC